MRAPICSSTSNTPVRVGLSPTFSMVRSAPGTSAPATSQNAAELMSPGTTTCWPVREAPGLTLTWRPISPPTSKSAPKALSIRSLWSREWAGSITVVGPSAVSAASSSADFTWALATGVPTTAPRSLRPCTASGARLPPLRPRTSAPMRARGWPTRCIGRLRSDASPLSTK